MPRQRKFIFIVVVIFDFHQIVSVMHFSGICAVCDVALFRIIIVQRILGACKNSRTALGHNVVAEKVASIFGIVGLIAMKTKRIQNNMAYDIFSDS